MRRQGTERIKKKKLIRTALPTHRNIDPYILFSVDENTHQTLITCASLFYLHIKKGLANGAK